MQLNIRFLTTEAFIYECRDLPYADKMAESMAHIRYCKLESYKEVVLGVIRVPEVVGRTKGALTFGFYLYKNGIIFVEEEDVLYKRWNGIYEQIEEVTEPSQYLLMVLEDLLSKDILCLQKVEKKMSTLEEGIFREKELPFFDYFAKYRRLLSELHFYYEQMIDIGEGMQTECGRNEQEEIAREWRRFTIRIERFHDYVSYLREYGLQIRDLHQVQKDAKQNKVLNWLTIITTLFLPLTLLTGWYGMNFSSMPEVSWEHGYVVIIGVAVAIIVAELVLIKRHRIL